MLSRGTIVRALTRLSDELGNRGVLGELNIVGGTAMVLAFDARNATKDVDAIFEPSEEIRNAAVVVAQALELPADWLNDAVKGSLSPAGSFVPVASIDLPNLRVQAPAPEYMLAMKVLFARSGSEGEQGDSPDIEFLLRLPELRDPEAVMNVVQRYYTT